jgi:hypothetical protein
MLAFACDPGPVRVPVYPDDTASDCPDWTYAPAGEEWELYYFCGPCATVYSAFQRGDGEEVYWAPAGGLPCSCINEDHQWVMKEPECQLTY